MFPALPDLDLIDPFDGFEPKNRPDCRMAGWGGEFGKAEEAMLSEAERARTGRMKSAERRGEMIASFLLRRRLVAQMAGCNPEEVRFDALESGAPVLLAPCDHAVSVANKRALTVVALDRAVAAIGVDVEIVRETEWRPILATICDDGERGDFLMNCGESREALSAFFRMWTLKEAVLKATGQGFRAGPKAVRVFPGDVGGPGTGMLTAFGTTFDYWTADQGDAIVSLARQR